MLPVAPSCATGIRRGNSDPAAAVHRDPLLPQRFHARERTCIRLTIAARRSPAATAVDFANTDLTEILLRAAERDTPACNMSVGLLELAPPIDTLERATGEAPFHRSPKQ